MKKLDSFTQLVIGGIYNRVYTGPSEAYRRINGKETFQVVQTDPVLGIETLYDQFGSAHTEELRLRQITIPCPEKAFEEFELYECEDSSEWFRKSVRVSSLDEALQNGLPISEIQGKNFRNTNFVAMWGHGQKFFGLTLSFNVEDKTSQPLLQAIVILWKTWDEMYADFEKHGVSVEK